MECLHATLRSAYPQCAAVMLLQLRQKAIVLNIHYNVSCKMTVHSLKWWILWKWLKN